MQKWLPVATVLATVLRPATAFTAQPAARLHVGGPSLALAASSHRKRLVTPRRTMLRMVAAADTAATKIVGPKWYAPTLRHTPTYCNNLQQ